jgi:hypothetical protein
MLRARRSCVLLLSVMMISVALLPASATITARWSEVFLASGQWLDYDFTPSTTGEILLRLSLRPPQGSVAIRLSRQGEQTPVLDQIGSPSQTVKAAVTEADVGKVWLLRITNVGQQTLEGRIELTFPRRYCVDITAQFRVRISYEAGTELEDLHCQQLLSILRSLPSDHIRRLRSIHAEPPSAFLYGYCYPPCTALIMPGLRAGRTFVLVAYHELGHTVHFTRLNADQQDRWEKLFNESGRDPDNFARDPIDRSLYAMTNQYEDFAVTYSAYIANTQLYITEAVARSQRAKPLLLQKFKILLEIFHHTVENQPRVYIYRVGTEAPTPRIERASVPLTAEGLPDFEAQTTWECFSLCS